MYYEINVSLNGKHYFATHERSITTEKEALLLFEVFSQKFPASEGYQVSLTHWQKMGYQIK